MGLDMMMYSVIKDYGKVIDINPEKVHSLGEEIAYWRKANAIHKWMVDNVQNGTDDCGVYPVKLEKLHELQELVKRVLKTKNYDLLPTQDGFFFGGLAYDEWYVARLKDTKRFLKKAIKLAKKGYHIYYNSSW